MFSEEIKDSLSALTKILKLQPIYIYFASSGARRRGQAEIGSCPVRAAINSVQLCQIKAFFISTSTESKSYSKVKINDKIQIHIEQCVIDDFSK